MTEKEKGLQSEKRQESLVEALGRLKGLTPLKRIEGKRETQKMPSEPIQRRGKKG